MKTKLMHRLYRLAYLGKRLQWFLTRPVTFGVNILMVRDNQVLLVKPSYKNGWTLPGGGVKPDETLAEAARREAAEEVGATLHELSLFGIFSNLHGDNSDHITVFLSEDFTLVPRQSYEIQKYRFFLPDRLPTTIGEGTRRRIVEYYKDMRPGYGRW